MYNCRGLSRTKEERATIHRKQRAVRPVGPVGRTGLDEAEDKLSSYRLTGVTATGSRALYVQYLHHPVYGIWHTMDLPVIH